MANLPEITTEPELDDTQGIELDLELLFNKFILPIDRTRSFAAPTMVERPVVKDNGSVISNVANTSDIDSSKPQESRTHAFYRMIGLPVINENFEFYNPGFDPTLKGDVRKKNLNISSKIPSAVRLSHTLREISARKRRAIFSRISVDAALYAIAMGVPNGTKPILNMNPAESFNFLNQKDEQKFNIPEREKYIAKRYIRRDGEEIFNFFDEGSHILRPFNVDPNIDDTVVGFSNETRRVAAPFLPTKKDTGIERNVFSKRPGIEFILRLRLRSQDGADAISSLFSRIEDKAGGSSEATAVQTVSELKQVVSALLNEEGVNDEDIVKGLENVTNLQLINLNKLVKTIKGVVEVLIKSINDIKNVSKKIKWAPLPAEGGPENGSDSTNLVLPWTTTELEKRILNLTIRASETNRVGTLSDDDEISGSDFYLSQFENVERTWQSQLEEATEARDNYQKIGSDALTAIEIILGEISGLGLIDVLAIYTALWAIDIDVLLSMLDENAFSRLYNNPDLRTAEVEARRASGPQMGILEAMQAFERQIINILSFTDRIFRQKLGSPVNEEGGNVPKVEL